MLLVTKIDVVDVDGDDREIHHYGPPNFRSLTKENRDAPIEEIAVTKEMVFGRRFVNAKGKLFCIGLSKQVQEAIGLPMEAFRNMESEIETHLVTICQLRGRSVGMKKEIKRFKTMGLWNRIKFMFSGKY